MLKARRINRIAVENYQKPQNNDNKGSNYDVAFIHVIWLVIIRWRWIEPSPTHLKIPGTWVFSESSGRKGAATEENRYD